MPDPISETFASLQDTTLYERREGVPIFMPHDIRRPKLDAHGNPVVGPDGKPVLNELKVTTADLEEIIQNAKQDFESGMLVKGTLGHFDYRPGVPETAQPPIACYYPAAEWRVGKLPSGEPAILTTQYIRRKYLSEVTQEYPERSPDYRAATKRITAVASLKRDGQLPLGTISYNETTIPTRYIDEAKMDPTDEPSADQPDEQFMAKCDQYMQSKYPHLPAMHTQYAATAMGAQPMPGAAPPVAGAPTAAPPPQPAPQPAGGPPDKPGKEQPDKPEQHMNTAPAQYAALERRLADSEAKIAASEKKARHAERRGDLVQLQSTHGILFDLNDELKDLCDLPPEQYQRSLAKIARNYPRDPTRIPDVPVATNGTPDDPEQYLRTTEAGSDELTQYLKHEAQQGRYPEYEDALAAVAKKRKR